MYCDTRGVLNSIQVQWTQVILYMYSVLSLHVTTCNYNM